MELLTIFKISKDSLNIQSYDTYSELHNHIFKISLGQKLSKKVDILHQCIYPKIWNDIEHI